MVPHFARIRKFGEVYFSTQALQGRSTQSDRYYEYLAQFRNAIAISAPHEKRSSGRLASALASTESILGASPLRLPAIWAGRH
jgi:hypothetical protein